MEDSDQRSIRLARNVTHRVERVHGLAISGEEKKKKKRRRSNVLLVLVFAQPTVGMHAQFGPLECARSTIEGEAIGFSSFLLSSGAPCTRSQSQGSVYRRDFYESSLWILREGRSSGSVSWKGVSLVKRRRRAEKKLRRTEILFLCEDLRILSISL